MNEKRQPGSPLPRPQHERVDLPEDIHMDFWRIAIREWDWQVSRIQSKLLYHNKARLPFEGEAPA